MPKAASPIPAGYQTVIPYLILKDASKAVEFYKKAFGAEEVFRSPLPDGRLMHVDLVIGGSHIYLTDEMPERNALGPATLKAAHATVHLFVQDVDKVYQRAVDNGAQVEMPPQDMFWGDRFGRLIDPFGQPWSIATRKEDLTKEEVSIRQKEFFANMPDSKCPANVN
jgi:PhnB protein